MRVAPASDSSIIVYLGDEISAETHRRVLRLFRMFADLHDLRIRNLHPAYTSLLIDFDPLTMGMEELQPVLDAFENARMTVAPPPPRTVEIPVCYDAEFALDLAAVAAFTHLTADEVVKRHAAASYTVFFLGFTPGFGYLGGLPDELQVPRLASPRKRVAAGSVGIAGEQTGVYPSDSPGGWQLIGKTPLRMFDAKAPSPSLLEPGDRVRFVPVARAEFDRIGKEQSR
jgi:KipI family sensor histidine kinase inhibitor